MRSPLPARRFAPAAALALALTTVLTACNDDPSGGGGRGGDDPAAGGADAPGDWSVFVYMDADNNLEPAALEDLTEMTEASGTRFVVLVDRAEGFTADDALGLGDFTDARLLRIEDGQVETLDSPGELNMGDPATVTGFLSSGLREHASDHNAFVVWDHGGAWRGAAWDDSHDGDNLQLPELSSGISAALEQADHDRLDLVGFDACLMADFSVAEALAPVADHMIASQELEPGQGWDWTGITDDGSSTTEQFTTRIVDSYTEAAIAAGIQDTTLSVLDLDEIDAVGEALDGLEDVLSEPGAASIVGRVAAARSSSTSYGRDPDPTQDYWLVDLGNLAEGLAGLDETADVAADLTEAIDDAVVSGRYGPAAARSTGLALYFPESVDYRDPAYEGSATGLIDAFYQRVAEVPDSELPLYVDEDRLLEEHQVSEDSSGIELSADLTPGGGGNVAFTRLFWGQVDIDQPTNVVLFGRRNAAIEGDTVSGSYDWRYLEVTDGAETTVAFADLTYAPSGELARITVPMTFVRGGATARGRIVLSVVDGEIAAETFYVRVPGGGVSPITVQAGDQFVPMLGHRDLARGGTKWQPATQRLLAADAAALDWTYGPIPPAVAVMLGLAFEGVNGFRDFVFYGTASP